MSAYAVVEINGLQYKVTKGQELKTQRVPAKKDGTFNTDKVLMLKDAKKVCVGAPYVKGASVLCEVLSQFRGDKVIAFKYKKRKSSQWKRGHRQDMSLLKVKEIKVE